MDYGAYIPNASAAILHSRATTADDDDEKSEKDVSFYYLLIELRKVICNGFERLFRFPKHVWIRGTMPVCVALH